MYSKTGFQPSRCLSLIYYYNCQSNLIRPMSEKKRALCKLHTMNAIQVGSCLTCTSSSPICQTKGCIKHHAQPQKMHTSYTVKQIQQITDEYVSTNVLKRNILKKQINDYFAVLKSQIESIYHIIYTIAENFKFDAILLDENERKLADLLIAKSYSELTCSDISRIIPKIIKCSSYEQNQYNHLKDFIKNQRDNLQTIVNSVILNLPYFRLNQNSISNQKFCQISDQLLSKVNRALEELKYRPKRMRIRYVDDQGQDKSKEHFINLTKSDCMRDIEIFQLYCTWNIDETQFQINFFEALLELPFISSITLYTGYKVTSATFIEELVENKNIELKIYKKEWHF